VALIDWPSYGNVGDHLIYLGTLAVLRRLDVDVGYVADLGSYDARALRRVLGEPPVILLAGGGNFGDAYPEFQQVRERIILDFPGAVIVQLPQTFEFNEPLALARTAALLNAHENVTLLWRDTISLERAQHHFASDNRLCPDCAFGLPPIGRPVPTVDQVWLTRTDSERRQPRLLPPPDVDAVVADWLFLEEDHRTPLEKRLQQMAIRLTRATSRTPSWAVRFGPASASVRDRFSRQRLAAGVEVVGAGRVLVTDRLHGHILAVLLGVPHVVVDTGYGKIQRFVDTWTRDLPGVNLADSGEEAMRLAQGLAGTEYRDAGTQHSRASRASQRGSGAD
jgi:exopolysaccharide biosynthesis predicted pyruvyltransferase EpsI